MFIGKLEASGQNSLRSHAIVKMQVVRPTFCCPLQCDCSFDAALYGSILLLYDNLRYCHVAQANVDCTAQSLSYVLDRSNRVYCRYIKYNASKTCSREEESNRLRRVVSAYYILLTRLSRSKLNPGLAWHGPDFSLFCKLSPN